MPSLYFFPSFFFTELFLAVKQLAKTEMVEKRCNSKKNLSSCRLTTVLFSFKTCAKKKNTYLKTKVKLKYSWAALGRNMCAWYDKSLVKPADVPPVSLSSFS